MRKPTVFLRTMPLWMSLCGFLATAQSWTDRAEYDLVLDIRLETAPAKRLALIEAWKQKYPQSALYNVRAELELTVLQLNGDLPRMIAVSREILAKDPSNLVGLYWLTALGPAAKEPAKDLVSQIDQSAKALPAAFDKAGPNIPDRDARKPGIEYLSCRASAWAEWQREQWESAEAGLKACLQKQPQDAEMLSWLGTILALSPQPEKKKESLWHLSRAVSLDGDRALSTAQLQQTRAFLDKAYAGYHGGSDGLDAVIAEASKGGLDMPVNFRVETAAELERRLQDEELIRANPEIEPWLHTRRRLEGRDGAQVIEELKAAPLPTMRGTVVRHNLTARPKEIVVGVLDQAVEEIVLHYDGPTPGKIDTGTVLEFEATPVSFSLNPFSLTATCARGKLHVAPKAQ